MITIRGDAVNDDSKGHKATLGDFEYFTGPDGSLYRANITNPLDVAGYRQGGRFECYAGQAGYALALAKRAFGLP